ncbi:MAG: penicillin-binding transpeptidase domain-containing protein [Roseburia inulinivorans]
MTAAGKTGTAEYSNVLQRLPHAWFVGYAHREDKEDIAVAVIVEDSGSGSEYAVPIAKKIFDAYYQ